MCAETRVHLRVWSSQSVLARGSRLLTFQVFATRPVIHAPGVIPPLCGGRTQCVMLSSAHLVPVTPRWWPETSHRGSIYTTETGSHCVPGSLGEGVVRPFQPTMVCPTEQGRQTERRVRSCLHECLLVSGKHIQVFTSVGFGSAPFSAQGPSPRARQGRGAAPSRSQGPRRSSGPLEHRC